ncbi:MAG TPA: copper homeostasis membrane protein CopD [Ensifer sp.]|nr:copper homeostasis membrane protein CopD [Ensifer sp.]
MEAAGILADIARFLQYAGAVVVFGTALFCQSSLPSSGETSASRLGWPKPLLVSAALLIVVGSLLSWAAQSAMMTGVTIDKLDPGAAMSILTDMQWGHGLAFRLAAGLIAVLWTLIAKPGRSLFVGNIVSGTIVLGSFAFTGHGAASEGQWAPVHLLSDILHSVAAGVWLGALVAFLGLLWQSRVADPAQQTALAAALRGFSGTGSLLVAVLVATGLVNGVFLVGLEHLDGLVKTPYGLLLSAKIAVFGGMLALAALNRFRLTPGLETALDTSSGVDHALAALRRSLFFETLAGLLVLALVAVFGMMEPPAAQ